MENIQNRVQRPFALVLIPMRGHAAEIAAGRRLAFLLRNVRQHLQKFVDRGAALDREGRLGLGIEHRRAAADNRRVVRLHDERRRAGRRQRARQFARRRQRPQQAFGKRWNVRRNGPVLAPRFFNPGADAADTEAMHGSGDRMTEFG